MSAPKKALISQIVCSLPYYSLLESKIDQVLQNSLAEFGPGKRQHPKLQ